MHVEMHVEEIYTCDDCENFDGVTCDFNGLRCNKDDDPGVKCGWRGFKLFRKKSSSLNDTVDKRYI